MDRGVFLHASECHLKIAADKDVKSQAVQDIIINRCKTEISVAGGFFVSLDLLAQHAKVCLVLSCPSTGASRGLSLDHATPLFYQSLIGRRVTPRRRVDKPLERVLFIVQCLFPQASQQH